jgi:D-beta-D-heptose 7-phosphate kinase/D-beta-D-heptose 1-phosphate adenosyltransferase
VDREVRRPLDNGIETVLIDAVLRDLPRVDAVLISDYDKGTCTQELLGRVIESARHKNIPVFIDPARISDYSRYRHATLLTPNRVEAEIAFGRKIRTPADAIQAGEFLSQHWEVPDVLVKLDCDGMVLAGNSRIGQHFPTRSRRVQDVTGAGDMVLAIAGFCQPCGFSWDETIRLANVAAGLEVEKLGVAPVSWTEIRADSDLTEKSAAQCSRIVTLDEMIALADTYRRQGRTLVFTNGCFDLLHIGHVTYLQEAARLGDILVVAINSDESVRRLKGHDRPVVKEGDRAGLLAALSCVDHVLIFQEDTPQMLLRQIRPDVLVKGGTYSLNEVVGRDVVEQFGGRVVVVSHVDGVSTTKIVAELLSRNRLPPANV